jgi:hypothetical protein
VTVSRLPGLIRRAKALAAERDRLVEELSGEWTAALRDQRLSAQDLDELWAGLTEEVVQRLRGSLGGRWPAEAIRKESVEVINRMKDRVGRALHPTDGSETV